MRDTNKLVVVIFVLLFTVATLAEDRWQDRKEAVESAEYSEKGYTLKQAMAQYGVPGLSIAVIKGYKVDWYQNYGYANAGEKREVTRDTIFSVGSISKPVAATLTMILVQQEGLELSLPINSYLKSWKLPPSEEGYQDLVTIERLLSHTAGINNHGFLDYYLGDDIPSILDSLNGTGMAKNAAVAIIQKPGEGVLYSGGGYLILQLALEEYYQESINSLADRFLFKPLQMRNSSFRQLNEEGFPEDYAQPHAIMANPFPKKGPISVEKTAAGMWTTAEDLALLLIAIQKSYNGIDESVLQNKTTEKMMTVVAGDYSLGWRHDEIGGHPVFKHSGRNQGAGGYCFASYQDGWGVVILANSMNLSQIVKEVAPRIVKVYGWAE
jgi:CubicO group peptidase (beta-lactamase class C family)